MRSSMVEDETVPPGFSRTAVARSVTMAAGWPETRPESQTTGVTVHPLMLVVPGNVTTVPDPIDEAVPPEVDVGGVPRE